jgi:two-component system LytT family response regulator
MTERTALIVDDEALARSNLRLALAEHPGWTCVGACASADEARAALARGRVDLLLLDIQMPRQHGLSFAREVCALAAPPLIVFVTAFDEHATSAFDLFALDYLLKPFDEARFARMLARAEQTLQLRQWAAYSEAMGGFLHERQQVAEGQACPALQALVVRSVGAMERIAVADIDWVCAAGNYVELHLAQRTVLHRSTLSALAQRLPLGQFMQVHRTVLVRQSLIAALHITGDSTYEARLRSGDTVPVSERFVKDVRALFA